MEVLKELFKNLTNARVLDVGTGYGSFMPILKESFPDYKEIIGIDIKEPPMEKTGDSFKDPRTKFMCMDSAHLSFEDSSMDAVCISNTLHHLSDKDKVLSEMYRVLKPNGYFIINEMYCDNLSEKQMSHVYIHHLQAELDTMMGICHNKTFKKQEIIDIAVKTGLKLIEMHEYNTHEEQEENINLQEEKETLDGIFGSLDVRIEKMKGSEEYDKYKNYLEELKGKLYEVGVFGATELIIVGQKTA